MQDNNAPRDPIIGLDVGGHRPLFYCHVSTLTNGSQYFASRFSQDHMQPGDYVGRDEYGREVYFVDRNGAVFQYILAYLRNNTVHLPAFQQNRELWRDLRCEASFFCMNGLLSMLQVTYSCSPTCGPRGNQGILYWLGTDRGRGTYQNPYFNGAVNVGGWLDEDRAYDDILEPDFDEILGTWGLCTLRDFAKATFVRYRQEVSAHGYVGVGGTALDSCDGNVGKAVFVDLKAVCVRPTHYSVRYGDCNGMTSDWVFAGSVDGEHWDVLHEAKSESYIEEPGPEMLQAVRQQLGLAVNFRERLTQAQRDALTDWAERNCRRTLEVPNPMSHKFYRFLRIQKVGHVGCLHGTSLEIFGDVNESPDEYNMSSS